MEGPGEADQLARFRVKDTAPIRPDERLRIVNINALRQRWPSSWPPAP
jgi:hypothetical protein